MAEQNTDEATGNLEELGEAYIAGLDDDGTQNAVEELENQDSASQENQTSDEEIDLDEIDKDTLFQQLRQAKEEKAKLEKAYKGMQSLSDRHYNEQSRQIAKLEGMVQAMNQQKASQDDEPEVDDSELVRQWEAEIEENPKKAVALVQNAYASMKAEMEKMKEELRNGIDAKVTELDPVYREKKEVIDEIVSEYKVDRKTAMAIAAKFDKKSPAVRQPQKVSAPGIAASNGRTIPPAPSKAAPINLNAVQGISSIMRFAGLDEKAQKRIAKSVAEEVYGGVA